MPELHMMRTGLVLVRNLAGAGCFLLLGLGAYWTLRIGYADYLARRSPGDLERAVELAPLRADYWARLAEWREVQGQDARPALTQASRLNPNDAQIRTDLALREELAGNFALAEHDLLEAARLSRQFDPRWSLANYFLRRNDERFWYWIHEAFLMSYGDRRPLFQLCWDFSGDTDEILSRAIPDDNRAMGPYLAFLLGYGRLSASDAVALKMARRAAPEDAPILLSYCSRSLSAGHPGHALEVWNALAGKKLIRYPALDPAKGPVLTNGDFRIGIGSGGFDWNAPPSAGVTVNREPADPPYLNIQLSGRQPEVCELLVQFLPLERDRRYQFQFEYRTPGLLADSGLSWRLFSADGPAIPLNSPQLAAETWKMERSGFTAPRTGPARLVLLYERKRGTARMEGSIALRGIGLSVGG